MYMDECAQCHGEHGKGDGPEAAMHDPPPSDITDARHMNSVTDGEIFYQISEGRKPMPSFKKRLTGDQRWGLVLFVRSFSAPSSSAIQDKKPGAVGTISPTSKD
jgi:high-affinity iron transporter